MNDSWMDVKKEFGLPRTTDGRFTFDSVEGKELKTLKLSPEERERRRIEEEERKKQEKLERREKNKYRLPVQKRNKLLSKPNKTKEEEELLWDHYSPEFTRRDKSLHQKNKNILELSGKDIDDDGLNKLLPIYLQRLVKVGSKDKEEKEKLMDYYDVSPDDYREDPHYEMPGKKESEKMWRQEYGLTDWDKIY